MIDEECDALKDEWVNVVTFLILYAIFPENINQLYIPYLHSKKVYYLTVQKQTKNDSYLFQYEYPPDTSVNKPREWITHNWVMKNVGKSLGSTTNK